MKRPKLSKSSLTAAAVAAAVAIWMMTGLVGGSQPAGGAADGERGARAPVGRQDSAPEGPEVTVRRSSAEPMVRDVVISGRTEPSRTVEIRAETDGRVVALGAGRGERVAEGEAVAELDVRDRRARLEEAEALVAQRELEYEAAQQLESSQLVARAQIAEARALLASARAQLEQIRLDLERTRIVAPFDGMLGERTVELGDYVGTGDTVARIVDNDPLIAVGEASEREIGEIEIGTPGRARLASGDHLDGEVRYVAPVADESTRTFRIELAVDNPDSALPAGLSAEIRLPSGEIDAHFLSPALLSLNDAGEIGVKTVDAADTVRFHEVEMVRSTSDGVWVTGLPEEALLITIGQGFVSAGQRVRPVPEEEY